MPTLTHTQNRAVFIIIVGRRSLWFQNQSCIYCHISSLFLSFEWVKNCILDDDTVMRREFLIRGSNETRFRIRLTIYTLSNVCRSSPSMPADNNEEISSFKFLVLGPSKLRPSVYHAQIKAKLKHHFNMRWAIVIIEQRSKPILIRVPIRFLTVWLLGFFISCVVRREMTNTFIQLQLQCPGGLTSIAQKRL